MAKQTVAFRVSEEEKNYIYDLVDSFSVPLSKFFGDFCRSMMNGLVTYDGNEFKGKSEPKVEAKPTINNGIDLSELFKIAELRRETPESLLSNALRPYRSIYSAVGVRSDER